ncbi:MAG: sensor histidine kinase, partial [Oscillospiraceae bacterium]|nr:sensor histidine kinase [Oscillospiraceae bacterium]
EDGLPAGYVTAELSDASFRHLFEGTYEAGNDILVLDKYWDAVYASPTLHDETLAPRLRAQLLANGSLTIPGSSCTYYAEEEPTSGFALVMQQPKPVADWIMRLLLVITVASLLLSLLLGSQFSMAFSREIFEPIRELNTAMARIEEGDLEVRLAVRGTDEISQLLERFNLMAGRLKENLENSVRQQQELGDAQLRMMQAQLNPHFLYNTLDTLKWLGKINRIPEVSTISANLADILRSSITADEFVRLGDELALLERYVEIQSIRFPEKFVYQTDIEEQTREMLIPKLTLQPLVENAIIHGFEDGSHGIITVTAKQQSDELTVTVQDNGCGMSAESRERFMAKTGRGSGHLGLYNVDAILRLHYGEQYGLQLIPLSEGRGTCIRMTLPIGKRWNQEESTP